MSAGTMEIRARHWGLALLGALLLHGAVLGWLALRAERPGALGAGIGGIQVSLGPTGGTPGEASETMPEEAPGVEEAPPDAREALPPEVQPETAKPVQEIQPLDAPQPVAEAVEPAQAVTAEAVLPEAAPAEVPLYAPVEPPVEPAEVPEQKPEEVLAETPEVTPEEVPEVVEEAREVMETPAPPPSKPAPPVEEVVETPPEPKAEPEPVATAEAPPQEAEEVAPAAAVSSNAPAQGDPMAAVQGNQGKAGVGQSTTAGSASAQSAGGNPGDYVDYTARLLAWLEKHKKYPRRAKLRGYEGSAWLSFAIDRDGNLLDYSLEESTGHRMLDKEVVAMIERASPLPAPPPNGGQSRFVYRVPVGFDLH